MAKQILMPALTPTMESGAIARWLVQPGDQVAVGQVIAEIETDKSVLELETLHEGRIGELRFPDGAQEVPVDAVIALLLEPGEEAASLPAALGRAAPELAASEQAALEQSAPERAASEQAAPEQFVSEQSASERVVPGQVALGRATPERATPEHAASEQAVPGAATGRVPASPSARRLAREAGLNLASIPGTGPGGRVVAKDVRAAAQAAQLGAGESVSPGVEESAPFGEPGTGQAAAIEIAGPQASETASAQAPETAGPQAPETVDAQAPGTVGADAPWAAPGEEQALSTLQKTMARRMAHAKATIPHLYGSLDIRIDALRRLRQQLDESGSGPKATLNDWIVLATARALRDNPSLNAQYRDGKALRFSRVDLSIAVAIKEGLVTPVVRGAERKTLPQIAQETQRLAERARRRQLRPEEYQGGTFTISNAGGFGLKQIWPIINPPQAGILGIGQAALQPVATDGALQAAWILPATLAADHRLIDGAIAGAFLRSLQAYLEHPARLFLES